MKNNRLTLLLMLFATLLTATTARGQLVNYEMVTVGDVGNVADSTGYGAVPYEYQIGKYEVTIGQYAAFLNAVAKDDPNGLYNVNMTQDTITAGIERTGIPGSFSYSVIGPFGPVQLPEATSANRPIGWIYWFDAARFANWMSNGQPTGAQGPTTTENGAYSLNGATSGTAPAMNGTNPNTGGIPLFRIPTENEWYKAAYYRSGGTNAGYWPFATKSDSPPGNIVGNGTNQANWYAPPSQYAITQSGSISEGQNYLTDVGAFSSSPSGYGTYDQTGNLWEWNDLAGMADNRRGIRGGGYSSGSPSHYIASSDRLVEPLNPDLGTNFNVGFRLASPVPEPSTYAMALAGIACGGLSMWRRRKRS